jgi:hypothetical protein
MRALGSTACGCGAERPELAGADGPGSAASGFAVGAFLGRRGAFLEHLAGKKK